MEERFKQPAAFVDYLNSIEEYLNGNMTSDEERAREEAFLAGWKARLSTLSPKELTDALLLFGPPVQEEGSDD